MKYKRVIIAMSGGVDSSVAALLLKEQGYEVIGIMLRLWSEPGKSENNRCCTPDSMLQAKIVASKLKIPFYVLDYQDQFYESVVELFFKGYLKGITPNPCLACNKNIRWGLLLEHSINLGADYFSSGHYANIKFNKKGQYQLYKGFDKTKDQSYLLHKLNQEQLSMTLFPLGELTKTQVREIALINDLPVYNRKDSQDLCFLSGQDYRVFLKNHLHNKIPEGNIVTTDGTIIGQHSGLPYFTIGQRKGLHLNSNHPMYVIGKIMDTNTLIVGPKEFLCKDMMNVDDINWICNVPNPNPFNSKVKIRYKSSEINGTIFPDENNTAKVIFTESVFGITPGQAAVFYQGDQCLGGGTII